MKLFGYEITAFKVGTARVIPIGGRITHARIDGLLAGTRAIYQKRTPRTGPKTPPKTPSEPKLATDSQKQGLGSESEVGEPEKLNPKGPEVSERGGE